MTERMDEVVNPQLRFGKIRKDLSNVKNATNTTYWSGRMWCTVKLVGLDAGETYFYEVRLDFSELWGGFGRFIPPRPLLIPTESARTVNVQKREKNVVRLAMLGNLQMDEHSTSEIMGRLNAGPRIDIVFHLSNSSATADHTKVGRDDDRYEGDESDTDMGESLKALRFFSLIKPIATKKPFMTLPGNSDVLTTFLHHYAIPPYRKDPWYSFSLGLVDVLVIWTDLFLNPSTNVSRRQQSWLKQELARFTIAERRLRPWILVVGHAPLYCSVAPNVCGPEAAKLRAVLEPIFLAYHVDLYLSAHLHAYERTFPIRANGSFCPGGLPGTFIVEEPCAPVYVVNGEAGAPFLNYQSSPALWTAQRHPGSLGHGELTIHNSTHLQYRQVAVSGATTDEFWLIRQRGHTIQVEELKESFLESIIWLGFALIVLTCMCGFVRWVHNEGLQQNDRALRRLRVELAVLAGMPGTVLAEQRMMDAGIGSLADQG